MIAENVTFARVKIDGRPPIISNDTVTDLWLALQGCQLPSPHYG